MNQQLLGIVLAFVGSSLLNISQALQKIGLDTPADQKLKKWGIWTLGTVIMTLAPLIIQYATSLCGASLVGAMVGTGLASLALFSHFVMKEKIGAGELAGIGVILTAFVLIGVFSGGKTAEPAIRLFPLWIFMGVMTAVYLLLTGIALKLKFLPGLALACCSGGIGGFVILLQTVTMVNPLGSSSMFTNPFFYSWVAVSLISFFFLQLSYKKDKAIRIVPTFSSNYILIPVLGGVICFGEVLNLFQWMGVGLIFCGVALLTLKRKKPLKADRP